MTKRLRISLFLILILAAVGLVVWSLDRDTPKYRSFKSSPTLAPYTHLSYGFLASDPFAGGRMWITVYEGTNDYHCYRYDIEARKIIGELEGASPILELASGSQLLCFGRVGGNTFKKRLSRVIRRISLGRIRLSITQIDTETFWLLDMTNNSAVRLGDAAQIPRTDSSFAPSPNRQLAFNKPTAEFNSADVILLDADAKTLRTIQVNGWPIGWWSNEEILFKPKGHDFMLYDVASARSSPFLSVDQISEFFRQEKIDGYPKEVSVFPMWNGRDYDFYFTEGQARWQTFESYLVKLELPGPSLRLVSPEFKFEWSDTLDSRGLRYVYSGRRSGNGSSAVYLRDLTFNQTRTLVPDDGAKSFSLPNFYGESVIYVRSNALWRVDVTGSNHARLFPPVR